MKKLIYFFVIATFIFSPIMIQAQYKLRQAFPNLPVFNNAIEMVNAYDGTGRLFVALQRGVIFVFDKSPTVSVRDTFINLSSRVSQSGSETGLLGLAFHPNYESNRYFYVNYTFDSSGSLWSGISRYTASSTNPDTALNSTQVRLITLSQPFANHNGGKVEFGPDGYLYISFGDGGSGGDPFGNGQSLTTLLGKLLRINVDSSAGGLNYTIPVTNPFYGNVLGYKQEIFSYGLRNMWKFTWDVMSNRIYGGDVGQNVFEEVSIIQNGKNYGWNKMEGFHCYPDTNNCDTAGRNFTLPIWEYRHNVGQSITGGYVYRGSALPALYGKYIYADYQQGVLWALTYDGINPTTNVLLQDTNFLVSSFGVDQNNELYVVRYSSTGRIYEFVNTAVISLDLKAIIEGFYDLGNNRLNIRDTVRAYLHSTVSPFTLIDSAKTVIDSLKFGGPCVFNNAPNGTYYLKLRSRNGLETWSNTGGMTLVKGVVGSYDFTTDSTQAFGNNEKKVGTKACIFSGDVDKSDAVDVSDVIAIYNDAINFATGYLATDLTGDYTVDVSDFIMAHNNSINFVQLIRP